MTLKVSNFNRGINIEIDYSIIKKVHFERN